MEIDYQPKWKEELVGTCGNHQFTVEMTMGKLHVFFPLESRWEATAPAWAKGRWSEAKVQAEAWAKSQGIPFDMDEQAWVAFHDEQERQLAAAPLPSAPRTASSEGAR